MQRPEDSGLPNDTGPSGEPIPRLPEEPRADRRAEELAHSLSMLRATLEATTDGILVVDGHGKVTSFNEGFVAMCRFPPEVMASEIESGLLEVALAQLKDPELFLAKVKELYADPEAESFDIIEFKDGRTFERYSKPQRIGARVVGRVWSFRDVTERMRADAELRFKTALLEAQVNCSNDGLLVVDAAGKKLLQNQRLIDLWKIPPEVANDRDDQRQVRFVTGRTRDPQKFVDKVVYLYAHPTETSHDEIEVVDGTVLDRHSYPIVGADGTHYGRIWSFRDTTEHKRLEGELRQAQKMEAIGRLAGGIAHDFNNLLGVILGYTELAGRLLDKDSPARPKLEQVLKAADRASALTGQLLAFSRKQVLVPEVLDLSEVTAELSGMLHRVIGEDIELVTVLLPGLGLVRADRGQMGQAILNLAVNARDAMPRGGKLTIETDNVDLAEDYVSLHPGLRPGAYAMLAVTDMGTGIGAEVLGAIFEPFFTTKEQGKGTGLGLSMVHGFLEQSGGHVAVDSVVGSGTTFRLYLPRLSEDVRAAPPAVAAAAASRGSETVLVAEDEPSLRELITEVLEENGYRVLAASTPEHALKLAREHAEPIELLLTDVVMPGMSGPELAECLGWLRPGGKVLFMSGYTDDATVRSGVLTDEVALLQKPFGAAELLRSVREAIDR